MSAEYNLISEIIDGEEKEMTENELSQSESGSYEFQLTDSLGVDHGDSNEATLEDCDQFLDQSYQSIEKLEKQNNPD